MRDISDKVFPQDDEEDFSGMPDYDEGRCPVDTHFDIEHDDEVAFFVDFDTESEWDQDQYPDNGEDDN